MVSDSDFRAGLQLPSSALKKLEASKRARLEAEAELETMQPVCSLQCSPGCFGSGLTSPGHRQNANCFP